MAKNSDGPALQSEIARLAEQGKRYDPKRGQEQFSSADIAPPPSDPEAGPGTSDPHRAGVTYDPGDLIQHYFPGLNPMQVAAIRSQLKGSESKGGPEYHAALTQLAQQYPQLQQYSAMGRAFGSSPHMPSAADIGELTQMVTQAERPFLQDMTQGIQGLAQQLKGVQHLPPQYASAFGNAADLMGNAARLSAGSQAASVPIAAWALSQLPANAAPTQQGASGLSGLSALLGGAGIPASLGGKSPGT